MHHKPPAAHLPAHHPRQAPQPVKRHPVAHVRQALVPPPAPHRMRIQPCNQHRPQRLHHPKQLRQRQQQWRVAIGQMRRHHTIKRLVAPRQAPRRSRGTRQGEGRFAELRVAKRRYSPRPLQKLPRKRTVEPKPRQRARRYAQRASARSGFYRGCGTANRPASRRRARADVARRSHRRLLRQRPKLHRIFAAA